MHLIGFVCVFCGIRQQERTRKSRSRYTVIKQQEKKCNVGSAFKFIYRMYLFMIIMVCCPSSGEGSVCRSVKGRCGRGGQETAITSLTAVFSGSAHRPFTLTSALKLFFFSFNKHISQPQCNAPGIF